MNQFNEDVLFDRTKADFSAWLSEQSGDILPDEIEAVFADCMYRDVVALHRDYKANNEAIGTYVMQLNDYIEYQLGYIHFQQEFEKRKQLDEPKRTLSLSDLMDEMKKDFDIPLLNDEKWNAANPKIIELYRAVSAARDL